MYQDDGVSRSSGIKDEPRLDYDEEAKSEYRETKITHQYVAAASREIRIKRVHDNYTPPFEKYFFVAVLHDPGEIYGNHGSLNQITLSGRTFPLLTDGSPEARANRLRDSVESAWYYNENTHISVVKIFDDQPERVIGLEYLQH
jgi:alpha-glucosidase